MNGLGLKICNPRRHRRCREQRSITAVFIGRNNNEDISFLYGTSPSLLVPSAPLWGVWFWNKTLLAPFLRVPYYLRVLVCLSIFQDNHIYPVRQLPSFGGVGGGSSFSFNPLPIRQLPSFGGVGGGSPFSFNPLPVRQLPSFGGVGGG